ncbi:ABC transporter ATP-binding protein/permease [bacterium]|nr:ABC transporter ATP-binding protein/permease [bacterium]
MYKRFKSVFQLFKLVSKFFASLNDGFRHRMMLSIVLSLISSLSELLVFLFLTPILQLAINPQSIEKSSTLEFINYLGFDSNLPTLCSFLVITVLVSTFLRVYSLSYSLSLSSSIGSYLSNSALTNISHRGLDFFLSKHASSIIVDLNYSYPLIKIFVQPLLLTPAYAFTTVALILFLFFENPILSCLVVGFISLSYSLIYIIVQKTMKESSGQQSNSYDNVQKLLYEALSNILETFSFKLWPYFISKYTKYDSSYRKAQVNIEFFSTFPRFLLEALIFLLIAISFFIVSISQFEFRSFLVFMSLFAISIQKVVPNVNQLYTFYASFIGYSYAVTGFLNLLLPSSKFSFKSIQSTESNHIEIASSFLHNHDPFDNPLNCNIIGFSNFTITFSSEQLFKPLTFSLNDGQWLSLVGPSGSGKSSILSAVLGFIPNYSGHISIFSQSLPPYSGIINSSFNPLMGNKIAYVPQKSVLYSETLGFNLTFDNNSRNWNLSYVKYLFEICFIDFISADSHEELFVSLCSTYNSLSGGQIQRLALVRALYNKPSLLIADEFTSSLDGDLEEKILSSLRSQFPSLSVLMTAHRKACIAFSDKTIHLI